MYHAHPAIEGLHALRKANGHPLVVNHNGRTGKNRRPQARTSMKRYSPSTNRYIEVEQLDDQESVVQPAKLSKVKRPQKQNYLHADMEDIAVGVSATSLVWLRLLQLRWMRKEKCIMLSNDWLSQHGVSRYAKMRALQALKRQGLIKVTQSAGSSPRVTIIPRRDRRKVTKGGVANPHRSVAKAHR
jgi:hypothetical protein